MRRTAVATLAKTIRSKNAGVDKITFDVIFRDRATYDACVAAACCRAPRCAGSIGIPRRGSRDHVEFDPALAIKFTIYRERPSGSPGDADIFGSQQYGPLLDIEVPSGE